MFASKTWKVTKRHVRAYTGGPIGLSNDESFFATACNDRVGILDAATGALTRSFPDAAAVREREGPWARPAFVPVIPSVYCNKVCCAGPSTPLQPGVQEPIVNFVVSPTCDRLVTVSRSSLIVLWDVATGAQLQSFKGPRGVVNAVAWDPSGTYIATGAADKSVMVRARA